MILSRRSFAGAAAAGAMLPRLVRAQSQTLKIGVLNDQSGPYRDDGGPTSAICTWDGLELVATTPADEAFRPMSEGGCALVKG